MTSSAAPPLSDKHEVARRTTWVWVAQVLYKLLTPRLPGRNALAQEFYIIVHSAGLYRSPDRLCYQVGILSKFLHIIPYQGI